MSGRGQFGRFIIREYAKRNLKATDAQEIIKDLFTVLSEAGLLVETVKADGDDAAGYRLRAAVIHWHAGTGLSGAEDRVRRTLDNEEGPRVNPFFRDLYKGVATTLSGLRAKEHTAQVPPLDRQERESRVQRGDAAGAVLLADDGTRRRHQRPERRRPAERAAHPGELRAARRAGRPFRAARAGRHLLRDRQRPRPVLLPPA